MYQALARKYGWSPDQVAELTPYQQLAYLADTSNSEREKSRYTDLESYYNDFPDRRPALTWKQRNAKK